MPRGTGSGGPIGSGTSPTSPSSGSRNGRLRCTGPALVAENARWASGRHDAGSDSSGTGASQNHRTERPYSSIWSIVCGAPDAAQLGRPVGGEHQHRHLREAGLDHRRVEVGGRGAARAQQCGGHAVESEAERDEGGGTLVVHDVHRDLLP